jgi:hypothetical protein
MPFTSDNAKAAAARGVAARKRKADVLREEVEAVLGAFGLSLTTATRRQLQAARAEAKSHLREHNRLRVSDPPPKHVVHVEVTRGMEVPFRIERCAEYIQGCLAIERKIAAELQPFIDEAEMRKATVQWMAAGHEELARGVIQDIDLQIRALRKSARQRADMECRFLESRLIDLHK